jgi:hypothetical protein
MSDPTEPDPLPHLSEADKRFMELWPRLFLPDDHPDKITKIRRRTLSPAESELLAPYVGLTVPVPTPEPSASGSKPGDGSFNATGDQYRDLPGCPDRFGSKTFEPKGIEDFDPPPSRSKPKAATIDYDALANDLASQRKTTQAALVRFMKDKNAAPLQDVAERVHGNAQTSDKAMGKNARETSNSLAALGSRLAFRAAGGIMHTKISPE